jgi:ABC-type Zn uptake system ZnuABC Zn-binding protein ZnuA
MRSVLFAVIALLSLSTPALAKLKVITSITPLQSITQSIGGDLVEVSSIARGTEDPHFVEVRPSFLMSIGQANLYISIGMSLDFWARPLIENARNENIVVVNASTGIKVLGLPTERVTARMGDVHPEGNPHYWMDPYNIPVVVKNILNGLVKADPANTETYQKNAKAFLAKLQTADAQWQKELAPYKGTKIVTYHESWDYFAEHFKLNVVAQVEPKPGIPPSGSHTNEVIEIAKRDKVPLILQEPYYPSAAPDLIARSTGAKVVKTPQLCGGTSGTDTYIDLVNHDVQAIVAALKK